MEDYTDSFIASTAKDYDLEIEIVESIYKKSTSATDFYERLEEEIK